MLKSRQISRIKFFMEIVPKKGCWLVIFEKIVVRLNVENCANCTSSIKDGGELTSDKWELRNACKVSFA